MWLADMYLGWPSHCSCAEDALPLVWAGSMPVDNLIRHWAATNPSSLIVHRGDSWHSAVCKRPLKNTHRTSILGYIKVISCQASRKHPPPSASKTADWSRHPVWHIWARESNENSCFCPYGIQRLAAWQCAVPTLGKLSIINPGIWPAYELLLIKTSGDGGRRRGGRSDLKGTYFVCRVNGRRLFNKEPWVDYRCDIYRQIGD